jgi:hypothetical protein
MSKADLISRLEALTGPSWEADAEFAVACGQFSEKHRTRPGFVAKTIGGPWVEAPEYTKFIDAAISAVPVLDRPKGALWLKLYQFAGAHGSGASAWNAEIWGVKDDKEVKWWGMHASPAIALLIAICEYLRAKETEGK